MSASPTRRPLVSFATALLLAVCADSSVTDPPVGPEPVASIEITPSADTLTALGQSRQLFVTARDAQGRIVPGVTFTWTSSDPSVATVSPSGLVTALATGPVQINATVREVAGRGGRRGHQPGHPGGAPG
jgi:uncharacterized protein YjdB